jgi:peptidoglycan/LPS O-acetylase OafA/YrhL
MPTFVLLVVLAVIVGGMFWARQNEADRPWKSRTVIGVALLGLALFALVNDGAPGAIFLCGGAGMVVLALGLYAREKQRDRERRQ